jgi:hypothetical protein
MMGHLVQRPGTRIPEPGQQAIGEVTRGLHLKGLVRGRMTAWSMKSRVGWRSHQCGAEEVNARMRVGGEAEGGDAWDGGGAR